MTTIAYLLVALALILLNGFFVLAEFALVKVRMTRLDELIAQGNVKARAAKKVVERLDSYLATTQIGITMASLGLGWVAEPSIGRIISGVLPHLAPWLSAALSTSIAFTLTFFIITAVHITLGEQAPKFAAIKNPDAAALLVSGPLTVFYRLTYYPMMALNAATRAVLALAGLNPKAHETAHSEEELKLLLAQSQEEGRLSLGRLLMFENLFDFEHSVVKEVLTPRDAAVCLYENAPWAENRETMLKRRFSRYPLCKSSLDDCVSYVLARDLQEHFLSGAPGAPDLRAKARPVLFFSEQSPLSAALREMQDERVHMAIVKGPGGRAGGLATMEDIVEEIVGEIRDEHEATPSLLLSLRLVPEAFIMDMQPMDRFSALRGMVDRLQLAKPQFDSAEAWLNVEKREKLLTCALGHGAAFPHARLASLSQPLVSFARCEAGLNFPAIDREPVRIVFLILTPLADPTRQLRILSELAKLVSNPTLKNKLIKAASPADVLEIVNVFERRVPLQ
ncbi:MAG: CNNM domain-containing protein [Elusimicrobiales bacterium]|nr:CNNM domain-containing protein [Elusimicrobiales bacterium]